MLVIFGMNVFEYDFDAFIDGFSINIKKIMMYLLSTFPILNFVML